MAHQAKIVIPQKYFVTCPLFSVMVHQTIFCKNLFLLAFFQQIENYFFEILHSQCESVWLKNLIFKNCFYE
eukprot:TRINITY_DN7720_c0_g1_i1.p1 TRINITY_DN7720_c0_g1~~TRINITY_DN7720_c0_g1_i1.p1  ORF type:complete len:71 (+),score=6.29 TRINITY_DN7720_c0_g1_i1:181-393(+)